MTMQSNTTPVPMDGTALAACLVPFPASTKVHVAGTQPGVQVPFLQIQLHRTRDFKDHLTENQPVVRDYTARPLEGDERAEWWARAVEAWPPYEEYQTRTDRVIPVILLEPND